MTGDCDVTARRELATQAGARWLPAAQRAVWRTWRRLVGAVRRRRQWEFWPPWLAYVPIGLYMLWLGLRHGNVLLFTASNPSMPAGGLVGESKFDILQGLAGTPEHVARAILVDPAEGTEACMAAAERFMAEHGLDYPVVLKPDIGCRGQDVVVTRSGDELRACLRDADELTIVQEYVPGKEFGVFYYRLPGEERGHILSVTEKQPAVVVGDGERGLRDLILADGRAVCLAGLYLEDNADRLDWVPAADERVELGEIGAHARGFVFLKGNWVLTPALEAAVDAMSRRCDGFWFGRYDIRTPSVEDFQRGHNFKVIELNGVSSEATEIYDPAHGLWAKYALFLKQWRLAYEIGVRNARNGAKPYTWRELWRLVTDFRRRRREGRKGMTNAQ